MITNKQTLVDRFGGIRAMARAGNWPVSTVAYWGEHGVPRKRWSEVQQAATDSGIDLSIEEIALAA